MSPHQPASEWELLIGQLELNSRERDLASYCQLVAHVGHRFQLRLEPSFKPLLNSHITGRLKAALERHFGEPIDLTFQFGNVTTTTPARQNNQRQTERRQAAAEQTQQDPHVRDMQEMFDARITSIHPLDKSDGQSPEERR
jgi:DNA polymerase-3 subunit gamma/tau